MPCSHPNNNTIGLWARLFIRAFRIYQYFISPVLRAHCRFDPSCSQYAIESLARFGLVHGLYLTVRRLARCHPWGGFGFDPVPQKRDCDG